MFYYEINQHRPSPQHTEITLLGETQLDCFNRHRKRCIFKVGDSVRFKKPRKNPIRGVIEHIEEDLSKVTWSNGGTVPNYISIRVNTINKRTREESTQIVKTHEGKLIWTQ